LNFSNILNGKVLIFLALAVLFYSVLLFISDLNEIASELESLKLEYFLLTFPLTILTIVISGWRFHLILSKLGIQLRFKDSLKIFVGGLSMLITPGSSGTIIKSYILKKKTGHSISSTTPIIIYEKWLEFVSIIIVIGFLLFWTEFLESKLVFVIGLALIAASFFIFKNSLGLQFLNKLLTKLKFTRKFVINIDEFKNTTFELIKPKAIAKFLVISLTAKFITLVTVYLIFLSLNTKFDFFYSGQIYFTSVLIGVLSFIPGGIIVTEAGMLGMLLNYGVGFSEASILVLIIRFITFWFPILLGFIVLKTIYQTKT